MGQSLASEIPIEKWPFDWAYESSCFKFYSKTLFRNTLLCNAFVNFKTSFINSKYATHCHGKKREAFIIIIITTTKVC